VDARISLDLRLGAAFTRLQTLTLQARLPVLDGKVISYGECWVLSRPRVERLMRTRGDRFRTMSVPHAGVRL
jgi:hypothetical protein